jgi:hypothetical protein
MSVRSAQPEKREKSAIELDPAALEGRANPADMPMARFDPSPTVLGLDDGDESEACPNSRCCSRAEACIVCGPSPRGDCA